MSARRALATGALLGFTLASCGQETTTTPLRALDVSGEVSVLCLARDETGAFSRGVDRFECPDLVSPPNSPEQTRMHALVTQPTTGEVALVDLGSSTVVDYEPSQPGFSFMPVGAEPGALVSTPGGVASFVAVREVGREGIFGLPSSCIAPRPEDAPLRDIRTWPACRLPAAPGPMILLEDPAVDRDADPATAPEVRQSCASDYLPASELVGRAAAATRETCPADLSTETRTQGRQKLAVALPSLSEIWILDAQELLDRAPGSFDACAFEARVPLEPAGVSTSSQRLPPDLQPSSPECLPVGFDYGPIPEAFEPRPSDFALDDTGRLFVADTQAPTIHVLDATQPCEMNALPPLEPMSFMDPGAVITTRRIAVSPLTALGKRYVYAIDNSSSRTAGTLMVFDVSPGSTERTPIVRPRSALNPSEPPDRISLAREVADVEFAFNDFPQPENGIAVEGTACNPHPDLPFDAPGALYRPRADLSAGAGPQRLRGTFAFAALHSGQIGVIDVEDLDAACRRPSTVEQGAEENIFGCSNDDPTVPEDVGYRVNGSPTVTAELSCNVVVPHRVRSSTFFTNAGANRSAGLLAFPTFTLDTGRSVTTDQSEEGRDQPKMLAARHEADRQATLYVGPLLYATHDPDDPTDDPGNRLEVDPARAERSSLLLSFEEPRNYIPGEDYAATYEGVVRAPSQATIRIDESSGLAVIDEGLNASFCAAGVQDMDLTRAVGESLGVAARQSDAFVRRHADYAQLTASLLDADDPYWSPGGPGAQCGAELFAGDGESVNRLEGRTLCEQFFGPPEVPTEWRDLRIVEASEDRLLVEPRAFDPTKSLPARRQQLLDFVACCFPEPTEFQIRAGHQWVVRGSVTGAPHRVSVDATTQRCVSDCNPVVQRQSSRAFEISCSEEECATDAEGRPSIGSANPDQDFVCVVGGEQEDGIDPGEPGSECVFQNLTTRFAIYRGQRPSARDMRFRWQLADGFTPLTIQLLNNVDRTRSSPRSLTFVPELNQFVLSDGSARGITFFSPRNPRPISSIY